MRIPITPWLVIALLTSMLYSYTPSQSDVAPYGDDMLVPTFDTKDEFDDLERELEEEAWHFAEEGDLGTKLHCWTSCVWKKFMNLFGVNNIVPEECSWGTCPGAGPTE